MTARTQKSAFLGLAGSAIQWIIDFIHKNIECTSKHTGPNQELGMESLAKPLKRSKQQQQEAESKGSPGVAGLCAFPNSSLRAYG
eukprot:scaffold312635_cov15-Tisochrysis_lutea.AAC.1